VGKLRGPGNRSQEKIVIGKYDYDEFDEIIEENAENEISFLREIYRDVRNMTIGIISFAAFLLLYKGSEYCFGILEKIIGLWSK
jgi:hypothetical protein